MSSRFFTILLLINYTLSFFFQPQSEPFLLVVYDPNYEENRETSLSNSEIQKIYQRDTLIFITDDCEVDNKTTNSFIEGSILINGSFRLNKLMDDSMKFIRVDSKTNRLKACPRGNLSTSFTIRKDELHYKDSNVWSICFDDSLKISFIYFGTLKRNKKYCSLQEDQEIKLRVIGKYDNFGTVPDYPFMKIQ
ncbi:hypothetical protein KGF54_001515 [Candida jiufengensis]|uniref:uncharacterized protein n=1 Tax=Candida jiufengensis TaxID=497108 RepID=UPI0022251BD6|nr:uncharacterized protein KGF54_001515 [Candida jiufengensis]KAI5954954.1 hypothetical protein KGF54_001515 [Candida jiufengensis]